MNDNQSFSTENADFPETNVLAAVLNCGFLLIVGVVCYKVGKRKGKNSTDPLSQ